MNLISLVQSEVLPSVAIEREVTFGVTKTGKFKTGTFARAIVFATKNERMEMGQAMYAKWLQSGTFRPIVRDVMSCGLVHKEAVEYVKRFSGVTEGGPVSKESFVRLCLAVDDTVQAKITSGKKAPTGDKGFVYGVVRAIAEEARREANPETIEG